MKLHAILVSSLVLVMASCSSSQSRKSIATVDGRMPQLVGRWIFSPGDSSAPKDPKAQVKDEVIESPLGASVSLGEGGIMTARVAELVRRGTWKVSSGSLKIIIDPPPERKELSFVPLVEMDQLTLTGADGFVLVYHRDTFIAPSNTNLELPVTHAPKEVAKPTQK
jgi:hypothetical protein